MSTHWLAKSQKRSLRRCPGFANFLLKSDEECHSCLAEFRMFIKLSTESTGFRIPGENFVSPVI